MLNLSLSPSPARVSFNIQSPKLFSQQYHSFSSRNSFTPTIYFHPNTSFSLSISEVPSRKNLSLECHHSDYYETQQQRFSSNDSTFFPQPDGALPPKVFVGHSIYKGKAALSVEPRSPEFSPLNMEWFYCDSPGRSSCQRKKFVLSMVLARK